MSDLDDSESMEDMLVNPRAVAAGFLGFANIEDSIGLGKRLVQANDLLATNEADFGFMLDAWGGIVLVPADEVPEPLSE